VKNDKQEMDKEITLKPGVPSETALRILIIGDPAKEAIPLLFLRLRTLSADLKIYPLSASNPWRCPEFFKYLHCAPVITVKGDFVYSALFRILHKFDAIFWTVDSTDRSDQRAQKNFFFSSTRTIFACIKGFLPAFHAHLARKHLVRIIAARRPGTIFCLPESRTAFNAVWKELSNRGVSVSDWDIRSVNGFDTAIHRDVNRHTSLHRQLAGFIAALEGEGRTPASTSVNDDDFNDDPNPGGLKLLIVGEVMSAHAQAWTQLFDSENINVRFFSHHIGVPPDNFRCRTYVTSEFVASGNPLLRSLPHADLEKAREISVSQGEPKGENRLTREYLARVIRNWQPDIIDTIGMSPCGEHYFDVRNTYPDIARIGRWILQARQSDLAFAAQDPGRNHLVDMLESADIILSDNHAIRDLMTKAGCRPETLDKFQQFPATGGIDVDHAVGQWQEPPSDRRLILWPKCYDSPWAQALPVLQALKIAWPAIQPTQVVTLMTTVEMAEAIRELPKEMRSAFTAMAHIPQTEVVAIMRRARLMVAPSLVDGLPLSTVEAMASGTVPLVSPLPSLTPVFVGDENVLFASNRDPKAIASQIVRAMTDDGLVDHITKTNKHYVREIADRSFFRPRILELYKDLKEEKAFCG